MAKTSIVAPPSLGQAADQSVHSYCNAIREAFVYLLKNHPNVFAIGQGLWSPWYVGGSMTGLDVEFGRDRIIDSPVSELATTGAALGASISGYRPIVIHPRVDFMLLAVDQIVTQAAKWSHMFGGKVHPAMTIRAIISRGGEQGAQHSQSLYSWFAHIPGLRVALPATVRDARDLLVASVLCDDPVLYIDDKWLYSQEDPELPPIEERPLSSYGTQVLRSGNDITLVGLSYSTLLCMQSAEQLQSEGISAEVIDLRVVNPFDAALIIKSVERTRRLLVVDGDWKTCGMAGEVIASVAESRIGLAMLAPPQRVTLPDAPAPTSAALEKNYYPDVKLVCERVKALLTSK